MSVILKATHNTTTRRLTLPETATLPVLYTTLATAFSLPSTITATYKDDENDSITFSSDQELLDLIAHAKSCDNILRVHIASPGDTVDTDIHETKGQLDGLVASLTDLVSVIRKQSESGVRGIRKRCVKRDTKRDGRSVGIAPFFNAFETRPGLKEHVRKIQPETRMAFKKVVRNVRKGGDAKIVGGGIKDAMPVLRAWVRDDLCEMGVPAGNEVDTLCKGIEEKLGDVEIQLKTEIVGFVRLALKDEALVDSLRDVKDVEYMPWEKGFVARVMKRAPAGFDVHNGVACAACEKKPIVGMRYKCTTQPRDLCAECGAKDDMRMGLEYVQVSYPWQAKVSGSVPRAGLKKGDRGVAVKFLHYVLVELGFMNTGMLGNKYAVYGVDTEMAVASLQRERGLEVSGVYDEAARACLEAIYATHTQEHAQGPVQEPACVPMEA